MLQWTIRQRVRDRNKNWDGMGKDDEIEKDENGKENIDEMELRW